MKTYKKILLGVGILIALPFIIALFVKRDYSIQREITINKPQADVFNYVRFLKNQEQYSKWVMTDPAMKKAFRGTDGEVGAVYAWDGNSQAGKGEQEIKSLSASAMDIEVRFEKPMEGVAHTPIITEALSATTTKVKWGMTGRNKYPMNFMNLFMEGMLGKDLEASLEMLKSKLESSATSKQ